MKLRSKLVSFISQGKYQTFWDFLPLITARISNTGRCLFCDCFLCNRHSFVSTGINFCKLSFTDSTGNSDLKGLASMLALRKMYKKSMIRYVISGSIV